MKPILKSALLAASLIVAAPSAWAETIEVKMFNKDPDNKKERMVFIPNFVVAKPGDVVKFVSVDKGHNTASGKEMIPEGAEKWKSKFSKDFELTVTQPGVYGYICTPHESMGMVGMIVVEGDGMLANLDAVKDARKKGKAKKVFEELIAKAEALGSS